MPVFPHADLPDHEVPRIKTRILVEGHQTTVWEQRIHTSGHIPAHYHFVEEVLVILTGAADVTLGAQTVVVEAPASILIPARQVHALRPRDGQEIHLLAFFPTDAPRIYAPDGSLRPMPWEDR